MSKYDDLTYKLVERHFGLKGEQTDNEKDGQNLATSICLDVKTQINFLSM